MTVHLRLIRHHIQQRHTTYIRVRCRNVATWASSVASLIEAIEEWRAYYNISTDG